MSKKITFHLLGNAHLDPVWLWDWREGLNEGIITCRTILDLMDEDPNFTFMRGESAIYEHIEATDPATFARIKQRVKEGRWEVVGGSYIQPDTNLTGTETMIRHYAHAQAYFRQAFGQAPRIGWAADSFGHSAGLPEILVKSGMTGFCCTRPQQEDCHLEHPAFWWQGASDTRILTYRPEVFWYGTERDEVFKRFDLYMKANERHQARNIGFFWGLGNHGGGPTKRQLADIRDWAARHPEIDVIPSGLHKLFAALEEEEKERPGGRYPTHKGELNFTLRGCYVSVAKFKFPFRRAEAQVVVAEKTDAVIGAAVDRPAQDLTEAWKAVLFNTFHDVLPGTSIERAFDDQIAWVGLAQHAAQRVQLNAINALAGKIDTRVPKPDGDRPARLPFVVWNPHPHEYRGPVELEGSIDYRPMFEFLNRTDDAAVELFGPDGKAVPFQLIPYECDTMHDVPWRRRVVFQAKVPPMGWAVYQLGLAKKHPRFKAGAGAARAAKPGTIRNSLYRIATRKGAGAIQIFRKGKAMFPGNGFSVMTVRDTGGSWGGSLDQQLDTPSKIILEKWKVADVQLIEEGPERASVWVRFAGKRSWLDLTFYLSRGRDAVDVRGRVLFNERETRLKLVFPVHGATGEFEVPGSSIERGVLGEVPALRWVRVRGKGTAFGFGTDSLYGYKCEKKAFHASVVRASYYASGGLRKKVAERWRPAVDAGELSFRFILTGDLASLPRLAQELDQPLLTQTVPPHPGEWSARGSLFRLGPDHVQLLAIKPADSGKGYIVRIQEIAGKVASLEGSWLNLPLNFGKIQPWSINSFLLTCSGKTWTVQPIGVQEREP